MVIKTSVTNTQNGRMVSLCCLIDFRERSGNEKRVKMADSRRVRRRAKHRAMLKALKEEKKVFTSETTKEPSNNEAVEHGVSILVNEFHSNPGKAMTFYNPKMALNREMVLCTLATAVESEDGSAAPTHCLDAFGATGIMGLQWAKMVKKGLHVTINDYSKHCADCIKKNCARNGVRVEAVKNLEIKDYNYIDRKDSNYCATSTSIKCETNESPNGVNPVTDSMVTSNETINIKRKEEFKDSLQVAKRFCHHCLLENAEDPCGDTNAAVEEPWVKVEVTNHDARLIMHSRSFDFIHLDPFGCSVPHLDAAFHNVHNNGIVSITSTDIAALYGIYPNVTRRHYSAHATRTEYAKESAARLVIAAAVRAAAHHDKGLEVLLSVAAEHFVLVVVRVKRGAKHADLAVHHINPVLSCTVCHERVVCPDTCYKERNWLECLPCDCRERTSSRHNTVELGPMWTGPIYNKAFLSKMVSKAKSLTLSKRLNEMLNTLLAEAECMEIDTHPQVPEVPSDQLEEGVGGGGDEQVVEGSSVSSSAKGNRETRERSAAFYYNLHNYGGKGCNLPRLALMIVVLRGQGFKASATHFDPKAVRTNANVQQLKTAISLCCRTTRV